MQCLALPGVRPAALQETAFKHLLLVEVIVNGPSANLMAPAPMSAALSKVLEPKTRSPLEVYHALATKASKGDGCVHHTTSSAPHRTECSALLVLVCTSCSVCVKSPRLCPRAHHQAYCV